MEQLRNKELIGHGFVTQSLTCENLIQISLSTKHRRAQAWGQSVFMTAF